ncbi:MAG: hypothetical protein SVX43_23835 [Cyanobacteriota bacterium]|nr:hypothetical protein [Cyanobacteriota bacterium]
MPNFKYLTNPDGDAIAVVIPIEVWRKIMPTDETSLEELAEAVEDYCLNKATASSIALFKQ